MDTSNDLYQVRQSEFAEAYEGGEDTAIIGLVEKTGEWLETLLMDKAAVNAAMITLYEGIFGDADPNNTSPNWWDRWEGAYVNSAETRGAQFMTELNVFAFWGMRPDMRFFGFEPLADIEREIEAFVEHGRKLVDAIPSEWCYFSELPTTVLAAEARIRIDTGKDVTPEQLAAIAGISLKSVKNMLTPKAGGTDLRLNADGEIPGTDALRWLEARDDFKSSLWRTGSAVSVAHSPAEADNVGEVVFVPVAKDGTWFDPVQCRNSRGYTIGSKGAEEPIEDYRLALERLARMRTPCWRRPNSAGKWGIVAGISWQRLVVRDLPVATEEGA